MTKYSLARGIGGFGLGFGVFYGLGHYTVLNLVIITAGIALSAYGLFCDSSIKVPKA